jgi:predicted DNA-binding WGR domain protein
MAIARRQVILNNTKPGHNKYYELTIKYQDDAYYVVARWGRIEHFKDGNPQQQVKAHSSTYGSAVANLERIVQEKKKKGYDLIKDSEDKSVKFESKSQEKRIAKQTQPTFDRTEHVEVIVTDWWAHENIEERAV